MFTLDTLDCLWRIIIFASCIWQGAGRSIYLSAVTHAAIYLTVPIPPEYFSKSNLSGYINCRLYQFGGVCIHHCFVVICVIYSKSCAMIFYFILIICLLSNANSTHNISSKHFIEYVPFYRPAQHSL